TMMQRRTSMTPGSDTTTTQPQQQTLTSETSGTQQLMPAVSFAFDIGAAHPPSPNPSRHERRGSTWALPSVKERSKSLAFSIPMSETPPEGAVAQAAGITEADVVEDHRKNNAQRLKATEARWQQDAKKLAAAVQKELLQKCSPDFGKTYDQRIMKPEVPAAASSAESPFTPGDAAFSGFTFGEPSASPSAHSGSSTMPREAPQRSAVITVANTNFGKEDASRTPDNPIALALKQRKDDAQMRNDERLQRYRQATNRHTLSNAVDAIIHGKVGRVADFQEMAGMQRTINKESHAKLGGLTPGGGARKDGTSLAGDRNAEYLVDRQPSHTNFDVAAGMISDMVNGKDSGAGTSEQPPLSTWLSMAAFKLDHPSSAQAEHHATPQHGGNHEQLKFLRKASMARLRSMDNSELVESNRASFAQFNLHGAGGDADPAMELPGLSRRRSSAFFLPSATQKHNSDHQPEASMRASSPPQLPEEIVLSNESHWIGASKNSSTTTDRSAADLQATLRRRRSNVAALLLTSGLGRHDVVATRKSGNGDTVLYAKQRARNSNATRPNSHGANDPSVDHLESYDESPKFVSWGDSHRSSEDSAVRRGKSKVRFSSNHEDSFTVGTAVGPEASTTTSTASSGSPAYELINPAAMHSAEVAAGGSAVPMFMWDVEVSTHHKHPTTQVVDSEDDEDDHGKNQGGRLSVSLRRASSLLGRGGKPTAGHVRSTPQVSTDRKKLRSPGYTPDAWCLDASDFHE
ncbi:Hypothetical protein, putative, partial [Bodo saltans]